MRLLLRTHYTGSFDDPCNITHVLIEIDPRHQLDMRANLADVLVLPEIYSVTFFDWTPEPVSTGIGADLPDGLDRTADVLAIPADVSPSVADLHVAAPTIRYMPDGIMWHLYEKHGGDTYETATIPWSFLEAAAKGRGPKNGKTKISHANRSRNR